MNYAKRYGEMRVDLRDLLAARTISISHPLGVRHEPSRTAYNPTVSGDGQRVAYEAATRDGSTALWLSDRGTGASQLVGRGSAGAIYEPRMSGDGRILAFSAADAGTDGRALVFVRDVANGATTLVSRAGAGGASADDDAYEPSISNDGRYVAFTSAAGNLGADGHRSRIWVRDVQSGHRRADQRPAASRSTRRSPPTGGSSPTPSARPTVADGPIRARRRCGSTTAPRTPRR